MGLFSRKKDTASQEMVLLGVKGQIATMKCLLTAGIKEISLKTTLVSADGEIDQVSSYQCINASDKSPTLTQGDFSVSGTRAILTYLDVRGKGQSLVPKKARTLGLQNYWIDICYQVLASATQAIISKQATEEDKSCLEKVLSRLNAILAENDYIVGQLSFADPNVAAYIYVLRCSDHDMSKYPNIASWISRLEANISGPLDVDYLSIATQASNSQVA